MKKLNDLVVFCIALLVLNGFQEVTFNLGDLVTDAVELAATTNASSGSEIVMAKRPWKDLQLNFYGYATKEKPIILHAATPGEVQNERIAENYKYNTSHLPVSRMRR